MRAIFLKVVLMSALCALAGNVLAKPVDPVDKNERCAVCGMMVAKYKPWLTQIHADDTKPVMFDGVKDMMAYFVDPTAYSGGGDMETAEIWVKDYYTLKWIDGRKAFYVVGSDVMGPMGEEFVPFETTGAAENFRNDHKGKKMLSFTEIDPEMVKEMKNKHMMKMKKMK